jgi:hypothetical protein
MDDGEQFVMDLILQDSSNHWAKERKVTPFGGGVMEWLRLPLAREDIDINESI